MSGLKNELPLLSDKTIYPTQEIIFYHIGKARELWITLFDYISKNHPGISMEWRYYNDGKSWLMKITNKKKTVFWLSIQKDSFRTTFYFTDKAKPVIARSSVSDTLKEQFAKGKKYGAIRGITIQYKRKKDLKDAQELIRLKLSMK